MGENPAEYLVEDSEDIAEDAFPAGGLSRTQDVAEYLAEMIGQLESMSRAAGFDLLVYLLSMARVEAEIHARTPTRDDHRLLPR